MEKERREWRRRRCAVVGEDEDMNAGGRDMRGRLIWRE